MGPDLPFGNLPNELLEQVFLCSDLQTVARCKQVSKRINNLISQSTRLQYMIELALDNLDNYYSEDSALSATEERLRTLSQRREAWRSINLKAGGVFRSDVGVTSFTGTHFAWFNPPDKLNIVQLPSPFRGILEKCWCIEGIHGDRSSGQILEMTMDPEQDLLVLIYIKGTARSIHFRSLNTGVVHPCAHRPIWDITYTSYNSTDSLNIHNEYLAMYGTSPSNISVVEVFNWKTGVLVLNLNHKTACAQRFLTDRYLIIAHGRDKPTEALTLSVLDMSTFGHCAESDSVPLSSLDRICMLQFPKSHRPPADVGSDNSLQRLDPNSIYFHGHEQLLTFTFFHEYPRGSEETTVHIPISTVLTCVKNATEDRRVFPWEEWGPPGCHLFRSDQKICRSNGIFALHTEELDLKSFSSRSLKISLYDFGQRGYRKDTVDISSRRVSTGGEFFPGWRYYGLSAAFCSQNINTSLPARHQRFTVELEHDCDQLDDVWIGDNSIVITYFLESGYEYHVLLVQ